MNKSFVELGDIMLNTAGEGDCHSRYGTTEPQAVGMYALEYGDINEDGTLN